MLVYQRVNNQRLPLSEYHLLNLFHPVLWPPPSCGNRGKNPSWPMKWPFTHRKTKTRPTSEEPVSNKRPTKMAKVSSYSQTFWGSRCQPGHNKVLQTSEIKKTAVPTLTASWKISWIWCSRVLRLPIYKSSFQWRRSEFSGSLRWVGHQSGCRTFQ